MDVLAWEASPAQSLMARQLQAEEAVNWTAEASAIALDELSGHLSAGYSWAMDVWPHLCTGTSLLAAVYIVISNFLNKDDEAQGRPVDVLVDGAGDLLVTDDVGNIVWRVSSSGPNS